MEVSRDSGNGGGEAGAREAFARLVVRSATILVALHFAIWILQGVRSGTGLGGVLDNWDSEYYDAISRDGYSGRLYAFFPLFPKLVSVLALLTGTTHAPHWAGTVLSTACFAAFVALLARLVRRGEVQRGVLPATQTGWLVFLLSPASYVFHYNGTEGLFLLLSFGALYAAHRERWLLAAFLAGLCALTRTQGVFVAMAVGAQAALVAPSAGVALRRVAMIGGISGAIFIIYPLYCYRATGDPLAFMHVQTMWRQVDSIYGALATLWFGNPWQDKGIWSWLHHVAFVVMMGAALSLAIERRPRTVPLAFYAAASTGIVTFQGELANMFRFGAVVFPALFVIGDTVDRLPRWARVVVLVGMFAVNLLWTWKYAAGLWAG